MSSIYPLKILVVDDHPAFRRGMFEWISALPGDNTCDDAGNGEEAYLASLNKHYDIIFMDISMPVMDGVMAARMIRKQNPDIKIVMLSQYYSKKLIIELIDLGVDGYILKSTDIQELTKALENIMLGGHYYTPEIFHIWKEFQEIN